MPSNAGVEIDEEPEEAEAEHIPGVAQADPADLTPQGRLRGAVTDDPDFVWELPRRFAAADALDRRADPARHRRAGAAQPRAWSRRSGTSACRPR